MSNGTCPSTRIFKYLISRFLSTTKAFRFRILSNLWNFISRGFQSILAELIKAHISEHLRNLTPTFPISFSQFSPSKFHEQVQRKYSIGKIDSSWSLSGVPLTVYINWMQGESFLLGCCVQATAGLEIRSFYLVFIWHTPEGSKRLFNRGNMSLLTSKLVLIRENF